MTVAHATVASDPQSPLLGATDWNDDHIVLLDANDVGADPAGSAAAAQAAAATDATTKANAAQAAAIAASVPVGRTVTAGTGLTGGGALSGNITLNVGTLTVRQAAGVPSGAPTGTELPIALDSTALTGGLYVWTGAAWVLVSTIAPTLAAFS